MLALVLLTEIDSFMSDLKIQIVLKQGHSHCVIDSHWFVCPNNGSDEHTGLSDRKLNRFGLKRVVNHTFCPQSVFSTKTFTCKKGESAQHVTKKNSWKTSVMLYVWYSKSVETWFSTYTKTKVCKKTRSIDGGVTWHIILWVNSFSFWLFCCCRLGWIACLRILTFQKKSENLQNNKVLEHKQKILLEITLLTATWKSSVFWARYCTKCQVLVSGAALSVWMFVCEWMGL